MPEAETRPAVNARSGPRAPYGRVSAAGGRATEERGIREQLDDGASMERLPATAARSITVRFLVRSWSSLAARSAWIAAARARRRGRPRLASDPPARAARRRSASAASPRRTAGCPRPPRRSGRAPRPASADPEQVVDQLGASRRRRAAPAGSWWRSSCRRPSRALVEQLGPGDAEQQDRRVPGPVRDVLDQVEEGRLAPSGCRRRPRRAAAARQRLEEAGGWPRRSPRRAATPPPARAARRAGRRSLGVVLAGQRRRAASRADASAVDVLDAGRLLHDLDDGPERDALAVGQAAAAQDVASPTRARNSSTRRDFPTPAGAEHREQLARRGPGPRARRPARSIASSRVASDHR